MFQNENDNFSFVFSHSDEMKRERDFYKNRNLPNPKDLPQNNENDRSIDGHVDTDYHRSDEQVNICLECTHKNLNTMKRRYIRTSAQATITHVKKFVALKVLNEIDKYKEVCTQIYLKLFVNVIMIRDLFLLEV